MKKSAICIPLATLALAGCNNDEKNAQARLDNARSMYEQNEFFAAKNEIDSIRILYPKEFKVIREGLTLMRQVEQKEAERNLAFCDSLIPVKQQELEGLKKGFNFEKDSAYNEIGNYVSKQQTIERNIQRCYIRSGVNEKGEMYLASVYFGGKPINHTGIKLSTQKNAKMPSSSFLPIKRSASRLNIREASLISSTLPMRIRKQSPRPMNWLSY